MSELLTRLLPPAKYGLAETLGPYVWAAAVSYVVSSLATPLMRALARRLKIVDRPDGLLKPHRAPIAYLGGIAVYLGWVAGMLLVLPRLGATRWFLGLALGGGVALAVGLADDLLDIKPAMKLLGQVAAAVLLLVFGIGATIAHTVFDSIAQVLPGLVCPAWLMLPLSVLITVVLVVAACNAANLLDGLDGLCSGVTGIISLMFLVLATHLAMYGYSALGDPVRITATLAMAGAVFGFLPFNFSPATIFLGDAGSMLMGFFAAAMMLMFGERGVIRWVLGAMMIFGLPILDTFLALVRRLQLRRPIFAGDRSHLYDQLVDRGLTVKQAVVVSYILSVLFGVAGLTIILVRTRYAVPAYAAVALVTLYLTARWGFLRPGGPTPREAANAGGEPCSET